MPTRDHQKKDGVSFSVHVDIVGIDGAVSQSRYNRRMSTGATVTIDYSVFQDIQNKKNEAEQKVAELEKQLAQAKRDGAIGGVSVDKLTTLARGLIKISCFAVGNLPPESTRHWPTKELIACADLLQELPDYTVADQELGIEWKSFASEAERFELRRRMLNGQIGV